MPGVDLDLLRMILIRFSYLLMDFPEIKEIDMNPYAMDENGGTLLDAHIVLENKPQRIDKRPYEHLVISPYPQQYTKEIILKNGTKVLLRPIRPEDEPLEAEMFNQLSKQSLYFRFFGFVPRVSHELLVRFTQIDYDREIAIIAEIEHKHKKHMIGVVRLVHDAWNNKAEFAEVVADAWQGQGLGNEMMDFMLEIAEERGLNTVYASVLHSNKVMVHMFKRRGFSQKSEDFETFYVEKQISDKKASELVPA
jgi:acetyltransferase